MDGLADWHAYDDVQGGPDRNDDLNDRYRSRADRSREWHPPDPPIIARDDHALYAR